MRKSKIIAIITAFIMTSFMSVNVSASLAQFIDIDKTTRGDWPGNYGSEGYIIISGNPAHRNIPSNIDLIFENDWDEGMPQFWTWWDSDEAGYYSDYVERRAPGALYKTPEKDSQIASCYYAGGFFMVVADVGTEAKIISLYMHDYDEHSRSAIVYALSDTGRDLIEPVAVEQYQAGWYLRFQISGKVQLMIMDRSSNHMNAVLSGVFFDPADPNIILTAPAETEEAAVEVQPDESGEANESHLHDFDLGVFEEEKSVWDNDFIMAAGLLVIIAVVFVLGAMTLISGFLEKRRNKQAE